MALYRNYSRERKIADYPINSLTGYFPFGIIFSFYSNFNVGKEKWQKAWKDIKK